MIDKEFLGKWAGNDIGITFFGIGASITFFGVTFSTLNYIYVFTIT